jgi:hypothetical protein
MIRSIPFTFVASFTSSPVHSPFSSFLMPLCDRHIITSHPSFFRSPDQLFCSRDYFFKGHRRGIGADSSASLPSREKIPILMPLTSLYGMVSHETIAPSASKASSAGSSGSVTAFPISITGISPLCDAFLRMPAKASGPKSKS